MPVVVPLTSENGPDGICTWSMSIVDWSAVNAKFETGIDTSTGVVPTLAETGTVTAFESVADANDGLLARSTRMLTGSAMLGFWTASFALVTVAVPVRAPTVVVTIGTLTAVNDGVSTAVPESEPESTPLPATV